MLAARIDAAHTRQVPWSFPVLPRRAALGALLASPLLPSVLRAQGASVPEPTIPEHNRAELAEAPPRPPLGDASERARRLFEAIVHDEPARAEDFFLPRDAFRLIKGISDPDALWARIHGRYEGDIHTLHALSDLDRASFVRLDLSRRRGWVRVREESNRLPYWAQRHNRLLYAVDGAERQIEVRTMIAWDDRWYITHLSEFR